MGNKPKIAFMGAGSTVFAKNVLGDVMLTPALQHFELALYDIDRERLNDSEAMLRNLKQSLGSGCDIQSYSNRKEALDGASYVINAIAVGGYESTMIDFEIPASFGFRQTIADTVGIGGIFRALRTIPALMEIAGDMREVCPDAWFLNYSNPMAMLTQYMNSHGGIRTVGLCHSVQKCVRELFTSLGVSIDPQETVSRIAGINHMAWLLDIRHNGVDLYPELKRLAKQKVAEGHEDSVRLELMLRFGYYVTESSEHNAEYHPYFIKRQYPELIEQYKVPLDEYPRRLRRNMKRWNDMRETLVLNDNITHARSIEYASRIMEAIETNRAFLFGGNVINNGSISNLPSHACVEVPCIADGNGIRSVAVGALPTQLAALNMTNVNVQLLAVEAAVSGSLERLYQAAYLDPRLASELSLEQIRTMCDQLLTAHGDRIPGMQ